MEIMRSSSILEWVRVPPLGFLSGEGGGLVSSFRGRSFAVHCRSRVEFPVQSASIFLLTPLLNRIILIYSMRDGVRKLGGMVTAGLLFCGFAVPGLCLSSAPQRLILPEKPELKISWKARISQAPVHFRLYRIDLSGSQLLDEQSADDLGIETFRYIDRESLRGEPIRFRLCLVDPDGSERTLGLIDCFPASVEAEGSTSVLTTSSPAALPRGPLESEVGGLRLPAPNSEIIPNQARPRPPLPPPRTVV